MTVYYLTDDIALSRYKYKSWKLRTKHVSKEKGVEYFRNKYPGNLTQAAKGLLDIAISLSMEKEASEIKDLIQAVKDAETVVIEALENTEKESE